MPIRQKDEVDVRRSASEDEDEIDDGGPDAQESGFCPECGAEVWDQADICPKCFSYIGGEVLHRPPMERWWHGRWRVIVVVAILVAFAILLFRLRL